MLVLGRRAALLLSMLNLLHVFAVDLGRLDILQRLKFTDVFLSLASCANISLVRLNGALAHLEAVHSHIHLHLLR